MTASPGARAQIAFRTRVWLRLQEFGVRDTHIAAIWGHKQCLVWYHTGRGRRTHRFRKERRAFRARVWSRLIAAPFRMPQKDIAAIWAISTAYVCLEVAALRFGTLAGRVA